MNFKYNNFLEKNNFEKICLGEIIFGLVTDSYINLTSGYIIHKS